jgi:hypothetical protein
LIVSRTPYTQLVKKEEVTGKKAVEKVLERRRKQHGVEEETLMSI